MFLWKVEAPKYVNLPLLVMGKIERSSSFDGGQLFAWDSWPLAIWHFAAIDLSGGS